MMKIVFVCHANITRSQMAAAFFNKDAPEGWRAESAGTNIKDENENDADGQKLMDVPVSGLIFACMKEKGIDMQGAIRTALSPAIVTNADKVVVLIPHETIPDYLKESPKTIYWDVADIETISIEAFRSVRDQIEPLVTEFVKTLI